MSVNDAVSLYRSQLVAVIEASPNKRAACKAAGVHPSSFYRWKKQAGVTPRPVSWIDQQLERQVVATALANPAAGPRTISDLLSVQGVAAGPSRVWRILCRHRLNTRQLRYDLLKQQQAPPVITVAERAAEYTGVLDAAVPGDLIQFDCFHVGSFKETRLGADKRTHGQIWQYTAIDVASSYLWAQLHATRRNPSPVYTTALALEVAATLSHRHWTWKRASTDNGNEFKAGAFGAALSELDVAHRFIKAGRPQSNGKVERVQGTMLEEFYQPLLVGYLEPSITGLRRDLTDYLHHYNFHRRHHGKWNKGATPASILIPNPKLVP